MKQPLPKIKCPQCRTDFDPKRSNARFCSDNCRARYHQKANALAHAQPESSWRLLEDKAVRLETQAAEARLKADKYRRALNDPALKPATATETLT